MAVLTINFSDAIQGDQGFSLTADGSPVAISDAEVSGSAITFITDPIVAGADVKLNYAPGNVVDAGQGCAMQELTNFMVDNLIASETINQNSTITLTMPANPETYDTFRIYLDTEPGHRWEGSGTTIHINELTDYQNITDGQHTMYVSGVNTAGEGPKSAGYVFDYEAI